MGKIKLPFPVEEVVPHKPPMSLLRHVVSHSLKSTVCDVRIDASTQFFEDGRVDAWVGLEYMAQAVAAHAGMVGRQKGKSPEIGFWLGTRRADFFTDGYRKGQTLHIVVAQMWGEGELFSFDCSILDARNRKCLATAQLNVFRPADINIIFREETT